MPAERARDAAGHADGKGLGSRQVAAVRRARQSVWISTFPAPARGDYRQVMLYLAEIYLPAGSTLASVAHRARAGAEHAAGTGAGINFVEAIFLPQDESCFLLYQAHRAADVTAAGSAAGLAFDRVTHAQVSRHTDP